MYSLIKIKTISLIALTLGCFALSPQARAVCQEGCLTNQNTVLGDDALLKNTFGSDNTAIGDQALLNNTIGFDNTATGASALLNNTVGDFNTAVGTFALATNTSGGGNTAIGFDALLNNTTGLGNTATGFSALVINTTGSNNTANGTSALQNTTGSSNTANGALALLFNTTGDNNIALGASAGQFLTTGDNNIDIGNVGAGGETGIIRIGTAGTQTATFITGIRETPLARGTAVGVGITADGQLGVRASSERFKEAIKPMDKASEAIFSLKPVTFRYKKALDPTALPQFGLVAEQVAKVDPDLVARDAEGKPFTVRYDEVNAMLLNEFLKEHRKVEEQAEINQRQEAAIARLEAVLKAQAAQIQKVSDQLKTQAPTPRVVAND